jgi:hypothetical protein
MSGGIIVEVPAERDLTWMDSICNPWGGPDDLRFADQWQPIPFEAPLPFRTFEGKVAVAPAVAALSDPVAVLCIGKHKGILPPVALQPEVLETNRAWAMQHWPLPQPPLELVRGVVFERFRRWLADQQPHPLARLVGAIIDKRDLVEVFAHLYDETMTIARPVVPGQELPIYLCGDTWRVIYQPVPEKALRVAASALPEWRKE